MIPASGVFNKKKQMLWTSMQTKCVIKYGVGREREDVNEMNVNAMLKENMIITFEIHNL